jgi:hypothetical protein
VIKYKELQITVMITEGKAAERYYMTDDFCRFFDFMITKYTFKNDKNSDNTEEVVCQKQK